MNYLAHTAPDGRLQSVREHLTGTAEYCRAFASTFGAGDIAYLTGLSHDIGKYSDAFQRRLKGGPKVDHSTAGALECLKQRHLFASFCVAGHHGGLPDGGARTDREGPSLLARLYRAGAGGLPPYSHWQEELSLPQLPPDRPSSPLDDAFFIRMLYSCLVDADFLDTEAFMAGQAPARGDPVSLSALRERLDGYIAPWFPARNPLNQRRCAILERCISEGRQSNPSLFTLTVPTGGGKTVASLAFALHHALRNGQTRIIYVIPYTSIIEQTAAVFRSILGEEHVLEHHSGVLFDSGENATPEQMRLARAAENWDAPIIVTTAVQFFESLYSNRPSQCRKLHNLARSVIIFDEAQMLPIPYLRPCVNAIAQLVKGYGSTAVLCTATQPALGPIFHEFLPGMDSREICPPDLAADPIFRRVSFVKSGSHSWTEIAQAMQDTPQALCIVNSRKSAQTLYALLDSSSAYHLSTLMCPAHRKGMLAEIRQRLRDGLPCRVVSTSLIEAGVDVDFPRVFREEAGLDSVLQAAGRCNREGRHPREDSIVTVFRSEDKPPELFSIPIHAGRQALDRFEDPASPEAIECYFRELLGLKGKASQDKHDILPLLSRGNFPFTEVSRRFQLIDSPTKTVYIPWADGQDLLEQLVRGERSRGLFRKLGQYGVSVYEPHLRALESAGALELLEDGSAILRDLSLYSPETGLSMTADSGQALFI